jgi:hypothetical protein
MTFRVGQKVVCVDDTPNYWTRQWIKKDAIYTIARIHPPVGQPYVDHLGSVIGLDLVEVTGKPNGFGSCRFRPIVERQADITVFTEILRRATKPAPALTLPLHHRN